jgi:cytochrome c5
MEKDSFMARISMQAAGRSLVVLALLVSACGEKGPESASAPPALQAPPPADAKLARLYEQTCKACHTSGAGGAPVTGDTAAWAPRMAQGMPVLLDHTINGFRGMPPLGTCMDCSEAEFEALIRYMGSAPRVGDDSMSSPEASNDRPGTAGPDVQEDTEVSPGMAGANDKG